MVTVKDRIINLWQNEIINIVYIVNQKEYLHQL